MHFPASAWFTPWNCIRFLIEQLGQHNTEILGSVVGSLVGWFSGEGPAVWLLFKFHLKCQPHQKLFHFHNLTAVAGQIWICISAMAAMELQVVLGDSRTTAVISGPPAILLVFGIWFGRQIWNRNTFFYVAIEFEFAATFWEPLGKVLERVCRYFSHRSILNLCNHFLILSY